MDLGTVFGRNSESPLFKDPNPGPHQSHLFEVAVNCREFGTFLVRSVVEPLQPKPKTQTNACIVFASALVNCIY